MKNVPVLVKDTTEENVLLESLIENLHRKDLTSVERENAIYELWKSGRWKTYEALGKALGKDGSWISANIEAASIRKKERIPAEISTHIIKDTFGLEKEERKQIIEKVKKEEILPGRIPEIVRVVKKAPPRIKKAILKPKARITPRVATIFDRLRGRSIAINNLPEPCTQTSDFCWIVGLRTGSFPVGLLP